MGPLGPEAEASVLRYTGDVQGGGMTAWVSRRTFDDGAQNQQIVDQFFRDYPQRVEGGIAWI
jgi:hypothetical protein